MKTWRSNLTVAMSSLPESGIASPSFHPQLSNALRR